MRLGKYRCQLADGSRAQQAYGEQEVEERHRHRYELNNSFRDTLEEHGLICSGINPEKNLVEIVELADHPWFVGVQFHPELKSTVYSPHPLFVTFVGQALARAKERMAKERMAKERLASGAVTHRTASEGSQFAGRSEQHTEENASQ